MKAHNIANRFRQKRMRWFLDIVEPLLSGGPVRILDIGGTPAYWRALPGLFGRAGVEITVLNLWGEERQDANLAIRRGDGRQLDYADRSFDVVHSNSVIEHVGQWPDMQRMAAEVRRVAPRYFIQTPNYWFPLEPHYRLPFVQMLPERARALVVDALGRNPTSRPAFAAVRETRLLDASRMRRLFPDAELRRERFAGLTKSLVAIKA